MPSKFKPALALVLLTMAFGIQPPASAQESTRSDNGAKTLATGTFHGKVHKTSGRATIYQEADGKRDLRLTNFATSNGPDVHVVLAQSVDQSLQQDFVKGELNRVELGLLKANRGNQNYDLPDSADLNGYDAVVIYCERFHAVFGVAKLDRF